MSHLYVFAEINPKHQHYSAARSAVMSILEQTRAEKGCIAFDLFESPKRDRLYLFEIWKSEEDLKTHYDQPYTKSVFASYENWLADAPLIHHLHRVE